MKVSQLTVALGLLMSVNGLAHAATTAVAEPINKKITLTASINDSLFVSKPDGSTWYGVEEMNAKDYKQNEFSTTLPVRVYSSTSDFNVSLAQPLQMSNGYVQMTDPVVKFTSSAGDELLVPGTAAKITQVTATADGFDEVHNLVVNLKAPTGENRLGNYSGDLVMLFEPVASSGE